MAGASDESGSTSWKFFVLPMLLCLLLGLFFIAVVHGLNVPAGARASLQPVAIGADTANQEAATSAPPAAGRAISPRGEGQLARLGGFMAYRGHALLAMTASVMVILIALFSIFLFVRERRALRVVLAIFVLELAIALIGTVLGGTAMGKIADRMTCSPPRATEPWDFCSLRIGELAVQLGFNRWVEVVCTVAAVAAVFAIFIVARSRHPRALPAVIESQERCVTILMVAASTLLTIRLLLNKGFLQWAFADLLAVEEPSSALAAYIAGTSVFNGALETALLAMAWFIALSLMERTPATSGDAKSRGAAGTSGFSIYNFSAIFAPVLSAIGTNFLGDG